jgi:hypothetical protein
MSASPIMSTVETVTVGAIGSAVATF